MRLHALRLKPGLDTTHRAGIPFVSQQPLGLDVICSQGALTWAAQPYGIDSDVQESTQVT